MMMMGLIFTLCTYLQSVIRNVKIKLIIIMFKKVIISKQDTDDYDININTGKIFTAADTSSSNINKNNDICDENHANDDGNDFKNDYIEHIVESRSINNITTISSNLSKNQFKKIKKLEFRKQIKLFKKEAKRNERKLNDTATTPITTANDFHSTTTIINDCRMDGSHVIDIKNGTTTTSIDDTRSAGVMYGDNINNNDVHDDDDNADDDDNKDHHRKRPRVERKASSIQSFLLSCSENFSIVIDCSFEDKHSEASLKSLSQQIIYCYGMKMMVMMIVMIMMMVMMIVMIMMLMMKIMMNEIMMIMMMLMI